MSAMGRVVKRRQNRDFMIAMTKFCELFGILEIYVSWAWDWIVKFIYWTSSSSSTPTSSLPIKGETMFPTSPFLAPSSRITVSLWLIYQFLYRQNAIFHYLRIIIELLFISINVPFFLSHFCSVYFFTFYFNYLFRHKR